MSWLSGTDGDLRLRIHAQPGAKRSRIAGVHGDALKIQIHAPPVEGKANDELIRFLAGILRCRRNQLRIVTGELGREKTVALEGISHADALAALTPI